ncbi:sulfate permease [Micrococcoides hystricis]|uniref:Sulfate permease n=2 Tax=Micrococcales TaxID=85006 RepID=A0A7J5BAA7_9MICO|nr:sulfate permease [Gulosibacter chungangensis]
MERNETVIRLLWTGSVLTRNFLRRYMPTNILLDAIRTPRGLKWGVPAMLLAIPYFVIAAILIQVINDGGPAWLNVLVLSSIWNGLKMLWIGPLSLMLLARLHVNRLKTGARSQQRTQEMFGEDTEYCDLETAR